jgi:hypothetical protein
VDQAKGGVEEVVVQDALRSAGEAQAGPDVAVEQFDGAAGLMTTQDGEQAFAEAAMPELGLDEFFLALVPLEVRWPSPPKGR